MSKSVVLLSGGLDSSVTAYIMRRDVGRTADLYAMSFDYGQRHAKEILSAYRIAKGLKISRDRHPLVRIDFGPLGSTTALLNKTLDVPSNGLTETIPITWVPQRNSIFLAMAFAYAEVVGASYVYAGMNAVDYSGYPDCRPGFIREMESALNFASKRFVEKNKKIEVVTPLIDLSKKDIVRVGLDLKVPFAETWSCYKGEAKPCLECDSCRIRRKAFLDNGLSDPLEET